MIIKLKTQTIKSNNILFLLFILLIYKNFFALLINNIINILLIGTIFSLAVSFTIERLNSNKINKLQANIVLLIIFLIISLIYSFYTLPSFITLENMITSFRQFFIPLLLIYIVVDMKIDESFLKKILFISIPIYIFATIEIFLPESIIEFLYSLSTHGDAAGFKSSAYFFWEFGGVSIRRLGSLFFEPLTFGVFMAYTIVTLYILNKSRLQKLVYFFIGTASLVKSFFVVILFSLFINTKWKIYITMFTILILFLFLIFFILNLEETEIKLLFFTLGNHLLGLLSGMFNGLERPLLGHGLGTAGYLNELLNRVTVGSKIEDINNMFNNKYEGVGNESALGIMLYQLGYVFTFIYSIFHIKIIKNLIKYQNYMLLGLFLGLFIFFVFSESYYTLLLYIYPFILYRVVENEYTSRRKIVK